MITGAIKGKVDRIWTDLWNGGIADPLKGIEQLTYLMFIHDLDGTIGPHASPTDFSPLFGGAIYALEPLQGPRPA